MLKKELRKVYLAKRKALAIDQIMQASEKITNHFFESFDLRLQEVKYVHLFLSILQKGEVNTQPIIERIWKDYPHIQLIIPKVDFDEDILLHYLYNPDTEITVNHWGIPEPNNSKQIAENQIDMVLMPLVCVDESGFRVGYGKGHYDKFLAKCKSDIQKIGLSFFEPIEKITDTNHFDIPLDACVFGENCTSKVIFFEKV